MIARISIRCCRCARIAIATPIAPSTIATRQIRLNNPVARSTPCVSAGLVSRKSVTCASGRIFSICARTSATFSLSPSANRYRSVARLPGCRSSVSSIAWRVIITRGPSPTPAVIQSGSFTITAAIRNHRPPIFSSSPTFARNRTSRLSSTTTVESVSSVRRSCPVDNTTVP